MDTKSLCFHGHRVMCYHGHYLVLSRFTPTQLVDGLLDRSHLLSLVIDLTNTTRYYDPKVGMETVTDESRVCIYVCHMPLHAPLS